MLREKTTDIDKTLAEIEYASNSKTELAGDVP